MNLTAREFAEKAHASIDHRRKYTNDPYTVHTQAVADMLRELGCDKVTTDSAELHDFFEDVCQNEKSVGYYQDDLIHRFGIEVYKTVDDLTDKFTKEAFPDINRKVRKIMEAGRLALVGTRSKNIKIADLIDNTKSIVEHDPGFSVVYNEEKSLLLKVLSVPHDDVNVHLMKIALSQL